MEAAAGLGHGIIGLSTGQTTYVPEPIEITPTSGSAPANTDIWYTATIRDWNGALNMWHMELLFTRNDVTSDPWQVPNTQVCGVVLELNANVIWLKDDAGGAAGGMRSPGAFEQTVSNARCQLTVPAASAVPAMIDIFDPTRAESVSSSGSIRRVGEAASTDN